MNRLAKDAALSKCYRRRPDVRIEEVAGETLVLDDEGGQVHQLNPSASFIWKRCDGTTSAKQIIELLVEAFDVERNIAHRDVLDTLDRLCEVNLLCE